MNDDQTPQILIVEDDPVLRLMTGKQLSILGYSHKTAMNGEDGVAMSNSGVSLIFMDIGLPGIDGRHATLLIREKEINENRPRVPIIALTSHSDKDRCLAAGMDDFLQKPALMPDFKRMLDKWLPPK